MTRDVKSRAAANGDIGLNTPLLSAMELLHRAGEVADVLLYTCTRDEIGSITWNRGFDVSHAPAPDPGMYNGRCGEAVFFAALAYETGDTRYHDAALAAIDGVRRLYTSASEVQNTVQRYGYGLVGVGSHLYALELVGTLLNAPTLLASARRGVAGVTHELIGADARFEIFWGVSGLIFGLLPIADAGDELAWMLARACGEKLLSERIRDEDSGYLAWTSYHGRPATGFAHGSTGIAAALAALIDRSPDGRFAQALEEVFRFERGTFNPATGDWTDVRGYKDRQCSWCHGAPGIGLARLAFATCHGTSPSSEVVSDLFETLRRVAGYPGDRSVNLCCGAFGRAEFLLESGFRLENPSLVSHAHRVASGALESTPGAAFAIPESREPHLMPGFWQGLGGIGYGLLRLAAPSRHASVMSLASVHRRL